jgi:hypothetical protein
MNKNKSTRYVYPRHNPKLKPRIRSVDLKHVVRVISTLNDITIHVKTDEEIIAEFDALEFGRPDLPVK